MRRAILTDRAPKPVGPYSQAIEAGPFLFCSGQIAIDPATDQVLKGSVEEQTRQVMKNIGEVLKASGLDFHNVVKTTIFLTNMSDFAAVNAVYAEYFQAPAPARSTVEVSALPKGVNVEIEVVALRA